jgi:hypothetical protein
MNNDIENGEIVLTESFRYDPQTEMVACLGCDRLNPPDRAICLYCGKDLPVTEMAANVRRNIFGGRKVGRTVSTSYLTQLQKTRVNWMPASWLRLCRSSRQM